MAEILNFSRGSAAPSVPPEPPMSDINRRRLEGLKFIEADTAARMAAADRERLTRYEIDKLTFIMRRALDYIPPRVLRDLADEVATEHELRRR